jgi:putative two-component system response regulator
VNQKGKRISMADRILIVDDEETIRAILAKRLEREGYHCATAENGQEAINQFYKDNFSLVITDIKMPEMDGIELLRRLKAMDPTLIVIMVTAYAEIEVAVEAMHLGADDFILKPVDLELLIFTVRKALEKKRLNQEIEAYHINLENLVGERTVKLQQMYRTLKTAHLDSVKVLAGAIDAKDPHTRGHSDRVSRMSLAIASHLSFSKESLEALEFGAFLHDIGKIGIRDEVLQKPGPLTPEEYQHIKEHPLIGVKIVEGTDFFSNKLPIIRNHHEHFDGTGYPDGLRDELIPIGARIIAVPDAFDAMTSLRYHRPRMTLKEALSELKEDKGKQFDPHIVKIFLEEEIYKSISSIDVTAFPPVIPILEKMSFRP